MYICSKCKKRYPLGTKKPFCECGGLFDLDYKAIEFNSRSILDKEWSLFRYKKYIPINDDYWQEISLGEGMTPIKKIGDNVLVKIDYEMPTLSFKDRGAAVLIWLCKSLGINKVIQDSSGNAGNAIAAYSNKMGIECEIFVPKGTSDKKVKMIESHGAKVNIVNGDRDETADVCREKAFKEGVFYASHVYNPFFYQGTKTYIYEIYEQLGYIPEKLLVPLGNGTLFLGMIYALEEFIMHKIIDRMPKIIAVQSENCAPFYEAVQGNKNKVMQFEKKKTLAEGIAIGMPMRGETILKYIYQYDIQVILAPEDKILEARKILSQKGYYVEHTTAATYAAYLVNDIEGEVLLPLCGAGLKSDK